MTELREAKGTRDLMPEDALLRQKIVNIVRSIFERYGFSPIETPTLERIEVLSAKYSGGAEIMKECFQLKDQGKRDLGLRYDLTVPLARLVAMNRDLKLPFKRYEIGYVFRDGPIKLGRYRSFVQCDADVVGISSVKADAELLNLASDIFREIGIEAAIKLNSRKALDAIMISAAVPAAKRDAVILILDKLEKVGREAVSKELTELGITKKVQETLFELLFSGKENKDKLKVLQGISKEAADELKEILDTVNSSVVIDLSLARGLAYYTGPVFELFATEGNIKSSLAAGGRYDKMIGAFAGRDIPATGISFGLDTIMDVLKEKETEIKKTPTIVYVIPIQTYKKSQEIVAQVRRAGINADIDMLDRGISKNLDYANKMGIPFVIIIGEEELENNVVKLKDMVNGKEEMMGIDKAIERLLRMRNI